MAAEASRAANSNRALGNALSRRITREIQDASTRHIFRFDCEPRDSYLLHDHFADTLLVRTGSTR